MILPSANLVNDVGQINAEVGQEYPDAPPAHFARREAHLPLFKSFKGAILAQHRRANAG
jgi:hypothetical protein